MTFGHKKLHLFFILSWETFEWNLSCHMNSWVLAKSITARSKCNQFTLETEYVFVRFLWDDSIMRNGWMEVPNATSIGCHWHWSTKQTTWRRRRNKLGSYLSEGCASLSKGLQFPWQRPLEGNNSHQSSSGLLWELGTIGLPNITAREVHLPGDAMATTQYHKQTPPTTIGVNEHNLMGVMHEIMGGNMSSNSDGLTAMSLRTKPWCIRSWISQQYDFINTERIRSFSSHELKSPGHVDTKQTGEMPQTSVVYGRVAEKWRNLGQNADCIRCLQ